LGLPEIWTDGHTDNQLDRGIPIYLPGDIKAQFLNDFLDGT